MESNLGLDQTIKPDAICFYKGGTELQVCTSSNNKQSEQITNPIPKMINLMAGGEVTFFPCCTEVTVYSTFVAS